MAYFYFIFWRERGSVCYISGIGSHSRSQDVTVIDGFAFSARLLGSLGQRSTTARKDGWSFLGIYSPCLLMSSSLFFISWHGISSVMYTSLRTVRYVHSTDPRILPSIFLHTPNLFDSNIKSKWWITGIVCITPPHHTLPEIALTTYMKASQTDDCSIACGPCFGFSDLDFSGYWILDPGPLPLPYPSLPFSPVFDDSHSLVSWKPIRIKEFSRSTLFQLLKCDGVCVSYAVPKVHILPCGFTFIGG